MHRQVDSILDPVWMDCVTISSKMHTVLRPARTVLRAGFDSSKRWRVRVATNPRSKGGDEDGTIRRVYSTPMKNNNEAAKMQGRGWYFTTPNTSLAVNLIKNALLNHPSLFSMPVILFSSFISLFFNLTPLTEPLCFLLDIQYDLVLSVDVDLRRWKVSPFISWRRRKT